MKKKLLLSNGTSYVIHHKFQTTSTRTRNLPIEQSIYSPECIHWESDVFRPNYFTQPSNQIELNESLVEDDITNRPRGKTGLFLSKNHENDKDTYGCLQSIYVLNKKIPDINYIFIKFRDPLPPEATSIVIPEVKLKYFFLETIKRTYILMIILVNVDSVG